MLKVTQPRFSTSHVDPGMKALRMSALPVLVSLILILTEANSALASVNSLLK